MRRASIFASASQKEKKTNCSSRHSSRVPCSFPSLAPSSLPGLLQDSAHGRDLASARLCYDHLLKSSPPQAIDSFRLDQIIRLFAACGDLRGACHVFDRIPKPTIYSWNAIISAHVELKDPWGALRIYHNLHLHGLMPDRLTYLWALKSCTLLCDAVQGRMMQIRIVLDGLAVDRALSNTIVAMFAKCGSFAEARRAFDGLLLRDQVSWAALISGYADNGHGSLALKLYDDMQEESVAPDRVILLCVTKAMASVGEEMAMPAAIVMRGSRLLHNDVVMNGFESDLALGSCLIDMYGKCSGVEEAEALFGKLPKRNVVTWASLIGAFLSRGSDRMVLDLYEQMLGEGIEPDRVIFLCVLKACGGLGALCRGHIVDDFLRRRSIDVDVVLGTALIEMYVDCGHLSDAHRVMASLPSRNNVAWNAMIAGYAAHGDGGMVERCIDGMREEGLNLDRMGYIQILTACTHSGSLEHGRSLFDSLVGGHGDMPAIEHYSCMVDLLGRAGSLRTAESLVETMPLPPDIIVWRSLLSSCQCHRNAEFGSRCFDELSKKLDAGQ